VGVIRFLVCMFNGRQSSPFLGFAIAFLPLALYFSIFLSVLFLLKFSSHLNQLVLFAFSLLLMGPICLQAYLIFILYIFIASFV
jgi:hypothetical protein